MVALDFDTLINQLLDKISKKSFSPSRFQHLLAKIMDTNTPLNF